MISIMNRESLTKYPEGSLRELWHISMPLMISALASLMMIFVDLMFLSRYSLDSLNAAVNAGTLAWAFFGGIGMLTAMSGVFVSQYNGAKEYAKIGTPVWQMIWLALISIAFFLPLALFVAPLIYSNSPYGSLQIQYFSTLMFFGPFYSLMTGLSGFYIGRGKTRVLILIAVLANAINVFLDWIFIFGIEGVFPEMGIKGAAIATSIGYIFQAIALLYLFLRKRNREQFGTSNYRFHLPTLKKCLRVGLPQSVFYMVEIIGFAVFYELMTSLGSLHITVSSICQSIMILLFFFLDGLNKGVTTIAGNLIGAKKLDYIKRLLKSALKMQVLFSAAILLFFVIDTESILSLFFPNEFSKSGLFANHSNYKMLELSLFFSFFYLTFEGIRWIYSGVLVAAGDTMFLLIAGSLSVWGMYILPVYLITVRNNLPVTSAWLIGMIYTILAYGIYAARYFSGKWKEKSILPVEEKSFTSEEA